MSELATKEIQLLAGVGPQKGILLQEELGIKTFEDLLYYFPYKYVDRTRFFQVREVHGKLPYIQVKGQFLRFEMQGVGPKQRLTGHFSDGTGTLEMVWFKGAKFIAKKLKTEVDYIVFGKPSVFNNHMNIVHPEVEKVEEGNARVTGALQAFYVTSEKMKKVYLNSKAIHKLQQRVFSFFPGKFIETLPAWLIKKVGMMNLHEALQSVHFPDNAEQLRYARYRLKFEELFYIQMSLLRQRKQRSIRFKGFVFESIGVYFNDFYRNNLPFELTGAQKRVLKEIRRDVGSGRQMNRLLQGDVGSGKTMVGLMTMLMALDNQFQAAMMAPTEILATQHYHSVVEMLDGLPINVALLTGSTKKKEREVIHAKLLSGELHILIGTHALLEDVVQFKNLGLVVIDEQHRFGVAQRARLWRKNVRPPHVLVMTATPIPRTLAMTLYGDLDVSVIDELPPGRKPIQTYHYFENKRPGLNKFMRQEIKKGRQIYVVYPLIQESERMDYKNLEDGYEYFKEVFPEPNFKISMVHGKMKPADKEVEMQRFVNGETHIMVATTVIEVGVNVPNASVMVIESSERFGLSQLHQLRGRVGRGGEQSFCILMSSPKLSQDGRKRLETMVRTTDGFEIAEADLHLRGPGDIEGTQQSGLPLDLKIANLAQDGPILQQARDIAMEILEEDPLLKAEHHFIIAKQLSKFGKGKINWSIIS